MEELLFEIFQNDQQRVQYTQSMKHMICGYFRWLIPMLKKDCYIDWIQVIVILYCIKTLFALNTLKIYLQIISFPTYFSSIFLISPLTCLTWSIKRFAFVFPQNANNTSSSYHHSIAYHIFMCYHFVGYVLPNAMQDPHPSALAFGIYTALDFDYSY